VSTVVNSGGLLAISSGGSAVGTVVRNGGSAVVLSGGVASGSIISSGGLENLWGFEVQGQISAGGQQNRV